MEDIVSVFSLVFSAGSFCFALFAYIETKKKMIAVASKH